jgi:hypothetical protein
MSVSPPAGPAKPGTLLGNTTNPFLSCATAADHATKRVTVRASQLSGRLIAALDEYQRPNTPDSIAYLPLVEVRPERAAALFGLAHLDRKIIAGLERVIDRPLAETSHPKYITSRSGKSTTRIIGERNRRPQPLSQTGFRGSPR